ncbi:hypothetical protein [Oerskovia turbata]
MTTTTQTMTTEQVEALPNGAALHCTDARGRAFLAIKTGNQQSHGRDVWATTDRRSLLSSAVAASNPVRLVAGAR